MDFVIASKFDFLQVHQITELQVQGEEGGGGGVKKYHMNIIWSASQIDHWGSGARVGGGGGQV